MRIDVDRRLPASRQHVQSPHSTPTATRDRVELGAAAPGFQGLGTVAESASRTSPWTRIGCALALGLSLAGGLAGTGTALAQSASPTVTTTVRSGVKYDLTTAEVQAMVKNTMTADELPPGAPRFTARGVDPNQATKKYHELEGDHAEVKSWPSPTQDVRGNFWECTNGGGDVACRTGRPGRIWYGVLSCVYRNEADGQLYRVFQKSFFDSTTPPMNRMVCGGHRLVYDPQDMSRRPSQVDDKGQTLYLNPAHVIKAVPVTAEELALMRR